MANHSRPSPRTAKARPSTAATYNRATPQSWRNTSQLSVSSAAAQFQLGPARPSSSKRSNTGKYRPTFTVPRAAR